MIATSLVPAGYVRRSFVSLIAVLSLLAAGFAAPGGVTIKNFGKVDDHYYRGSQPTEKTVKELKALGIATVIDLRKDKVDEEESWVTAEGMRYVNIPLKASRAATDEQTATFLSLVNDPANWPVYVHCKGGRHRTGALTAVYRLTHDHWTADQAWQEMKDYDFDGGFLGSLFGGPDAQKRFVYSYYESHLKTGASPETAAAASQK